MKIVGGFLPQDKTQLTHSFKPEATASPSSVPDDEVAELQADLCVLSTERVQQRTVEQTTVGPQVQYVDKVAKIQKIVPGSTGAGRGEDSRDPTIAGR